MEVLLRCKPTSSLWMAEAIPGMLLFFLPIQRSHAPDRHRLIVELAIAGRETRKHVSVPTCERIHPQARRPRAKG